MPFPHIIGDMVQPVRFLSGGREGLIVAVGDSNVFVPTEVSYAEGGKPRWKDVEIRHAAFTKVTRSLDMPDDLVPADEETKQALVGYFQAEQSKLAQNPTFTPYKLNY